MLQDDVMRPSRGRSLRRAIPLGSAVLVFSLTACGTGVSPQTGSVAGEQGLRSTRQLSCRGEHSLPFTRAALSASPMTADEHEALPFVRRYLQEHGQEVDVHADAELRLLSASDGAALFAVGKTLEGFGSITFERDGSEWKFDRSQGRCLPQGWVGGREASPWAVEGALDRASRRVYALVEEMACAGGMPADGRINPPLIEWGSTTVIVTITVRPKDGVQNCLGYPPTKFSFDLPEPLGDRVLLDGFHEPPAPPGTPMTSG